MWFVVEFIQVQCAIFALLNAPSELKSTACMYLKDPIYHIIGLNLALHYDCVCRHQ